MKKIISLFFLVCFLIPAMAFSAELSKSNAIKILTFMGYKNVAVAAVVNGVGKMGEMGLGGFGGPNVALVIGYAHSEGQGVKVEKNIWYDNDIGWFFYEFSNKDNKVRLWTIKGYSEVTPAKP